MSDNTTTSSNLDELMNTLTDEQKREIWEILCSVQEKLLAEFGSPDHIPRGTFGSRLEKVLEDRSQMVNVGP